MKKLFLFLFVFNIALFASVLDNFCSDGKKSKIVKVSIFDVNTQEYILKIKVTRGKFVYVQINKIYPKAGLQDLENEVLKKYMVDAQLMFCSNKHVDYYNDEAFLYSYNTR